MKYIDKWYRENHSRIRKQRELKHQQEPWLRVFDHINQRCNNPKAPAYKNYGARGIKCFISISDLKELWIRDKAYLLKVPSIDRINNDGNYTFENCRFIEFKENSMRASVAKRTPILQFSLDGKLIREWESQRKAALSLGLSTGNLPYALKGIYKQLGGYIWKYKVV